MFKNYKYYCEYLNKKFNVDLTINLVVSILFVLGGLAFLYLTKSIVGLFLIILGFCYFLFHYISLKGDYTQLVDAKQIAFNGFYRYIVTMLENKEILYAALKSSLEYVDEVLVNDIEKFISEIEEDTSLQPFLNFSNVFIDETIKQMIILLYQTQENESISLVLNRINTCLVELQDGSIDSYIQKEQRKIERFYIYPILLSAIVLITVSLFIFTLIGEEINV